MKIGSGIVARINSSKVRKLKKSFSGVQISGFVKKHLNRITVKVGIGIVVIIIAILSIYLYKRYTSYDDYKVLNYIKVDSSSNSKYLPYQDFVIKYSGDGISYIDEEGTVWDESYQMKTPIVDICEDYIAVADKNSNDIFVYNEDGKQGKIITSFPIIKVEVANQGVVAALLEDKNANHIEVFDKEGNKLVSHKTLLDENGYPLDFSISDNGEKMMVSYITIHNGAMGNRVVFYNFSSSGKNSADKIVGEHTQYKETMIPVVKFLSNNQAIAVGENIFSVYQVGKRSELDEEVKIKDEIQKVFYSDKYIGFILENHNSKNPYRIEVYDLSGKRRMKTEIKMEYDNVDFSGDNVLMYDDMNCQIISFDGVEKFKIIFKGEMNGIIPIDGSRTFLFMTRSKIQKVKLK